MELENLRDALSQLADGITSESVKAYLSLDWNALPNLNQGLASNLLAMRAKCVNHLLAQAIEDARISEQWITQGWPINPIGKSLEPILEMANGLTLSLDSEVLIDAEKQAGLMLFLGSKQSTKKGKRANKEAIKSGTNTCVAVNELIRVLTKLQSKASKTPKVENDVKKLLQAIESSLIEAKLDATLTVPNKLLLKAMLTFETGATLEELFDIDRTAWKELPQTSSFYKRLNELKDQVSGIGYSFIVRKAKGGSFKWTNQPD